WLSSKQQLGDTALIQAISEYLEEDMVQGQVVLDSFMGRVRAMLYDCGAIVQEDVKQDAKGAMSYNMQIKLPGRDWEQILKKNDLNAKQLPVKPVK
ncbi:MAG TPA: hypothetical protein VIM85_00525, partial [Pseudomonadales bacterium]